MAVPREIIEESVHLRVKTIALASDPSVQAYLEECKRIIVDRLELLEPKILAHELTLAMFGSAAMRRP